MNQGGIEALAAATCVGIATNIEQSFSISTLPHLSIRGRATPSIMLTFYSYTTDLSLVILHTNTEMALRFNIPAAHP